jgi:hypothetical protein
MIIISCRKEEYLYRDDYKIESVCDINGVETHFNFCWNQGDLTGDRPIFMDLKDVNGGLCSDVPSWEVWGPNCDNINHIISFSARFTNLWWMPKPIAPNTTYSLNHMNVEIWYPFPDTKYIASVDKQGSSATFTITSVDFFYSYHSTDYYSISGMYSVTAIEDKANDPDTLRISNGKFDKLSQFIIE